MQHPTLKLLALCLLCATLGACAEQDSLVAPDRFAVPEAPDPIDPPDPPESPQIAYPSWVFWDQDVQSRDGTTFYLDPRTGDLANPGTYSAPLPGLAEVLAADLIQRWEPVEHPYVQGGELRLINPDAPIAPGDRLLLNDGDHGDCRLIDAHNPDYLIIEAAPGATPVLQRLQLLGVERVLIRGLTIRAEKSDDLGETLLELPDHSYRGPCRYVSVNDCVIESATDIAGWTAADWNARAACGISGGGDHIALRGNIIRNVDHGLSLQGDYMLAVDNLVENFCGDGLRGLGNDQLFENNTVRNCYAVNDNHDDGFQSWASDDEHPRKRVVLRGNVIIGYTDPDQPYRGVLQGIGCFDGFYVDWIVENNLIMTDDWTGIIMLGARDCRIVNNTVIDLIQGRDGRPVIRIDNHKDGRPSSDCLIRNNIMPRITLGYGVSEDHNLLTVDPSVFENGQAGDYRPRLGGPALDAGTADLAPVVDLEGNARPRGGGVDLGALER